MRIEKAVGSEVLERMLSAYGFSMQKELAEHLGIAKSNVAGWVQRGQVPGNAIVQCALDTGAELSWLVTGKLEKAKFDIPSSNATGKALYNEIMANGGKAVLRRILDAYGFTKQKQLCELLDISSGTVSTWIRRNYFPGDVVVTCALDTGASLQWLATGKDDKNVESKVVAYGYSIPKKILDNGILHDMGEWIGDLSFLSQKPSMPLFLSSNLGAWLIDSAIINISNGRWLLGIDSKYDIYDVAILPSSKITVRNTSSNFVCGVDQIEIKGKVVFTINYNI